MKLARTLALAPIVGLAVGLLPAAPALAAAPTPPVWETGNASKTGDISFYDTSGNKVTGGMLSTKPFVKYAVGTQPVGMDTKATLYFANPDHASDITLWANVQSSGSTVFPVPAGAGVPASISSITDKPVVTGKATGDTSLAEYLGGIIPDTTAGYANVVQVRMYTSRPGNFSTTYSTADVLVDKVAGTWTQIYPTPGPLSTTTSVSASPVASAALGASVTFTATVAPKAPGSVEFFDGTTSLGAGSTPYSATTGSASLTTSSLVVGDHPIKAVFTPTDTTAYAGSQSVLAYKIQTPTSVTLAAAPVSPLAYGGDAILTATATTGIAGSVAFSENGAALGGVVPVDTGTGIATYNVVKPSAGTHSYGATFTPTSPANAASVASALPYAVTKAATTTTLSLLPSAVYYGTARRIGVTVTSIPGVPTGTVTIKDGASTLATGTLVAGSVSLYLRTTIPVGNHVINVAYNGATNFATSAAARSLRVVKANPRLLAKATKAVITTKVRGQIRATVSAVGVVPTGRIAVKIGTKVIAYGTVVRGRATITLPKLKKKKYKLVVYYLGSTTVNAKFVYVALTVK